ncbi:hypothetical protein D3C83_84780 [compost metagenome]
MGRVESDRRQDGDAQTMLDVGLADVGIHRAEDHVGLDPRFPERFRHAPVAAVGRVVGDDGILCDFLERELFYFQQGVPPLDDDAAGELEAGEHD